MEPSGVHLLVLLGVIAAGAIPTPVNPASLAAEAKAYLEPLEPRTVVADAPNGDLAQSLHADSIVLDAVDKAGGLLSRLGPLGGSPVAPAKRTEDDAAVIFPTGGTTGTPKGVVTSHRALTLWTLTSTHQAGRNHLDTEIFFSPFFHVAVLTGPISTISAGGTVRVLPGFDPERVLSGIDAGGTFFLGAPTMYQALRESPRFAATDRSRVRSLSVRPTTDLENSVARLAAEFPNARLRHTYGSSEFGPVAGIDHDDLLAGRSTGVGYPVPGARIRIIDDDGLEVPIGSAGELLVSCPWQADGYWGRPVETAETWRHGGVVVGDVGWRTQDGWLTIGGRKKEIINGAAGVIFPSEVEAAIIRHPCVEDVLVYGVPGPDGAERVEAAVVVSAGEAVTEAVIQSFARKHLRDAQVPAAVRFIERIPVTANSKPNRRLLREQAMARR
jgi:fatty-acyl-CoA synthase